MKSLREPDAPANAFTHSFVVEESDIDELGHASNIRWVAWVNAAAVQHSASLGLDLETYREMKLVWVVRRHEVDYLGPAFAGEQLIATTWIESVRAATSVRKTLIHRKRDDKLLARAATTWVLLSLPEGKPTRIPKELAARYGIEK